ncbi:MAG: hypothetical protein WBI47_00005 [Atribacterales bacterium]|jgi:hypothetical protein
MLKNTLKRLLYYYLEIFFAGALHLVSPGGEEVRRSRTPSHLTLKIKESLIYAGGKVSMKFYHHITGDKLFN